jgi:WS/DGAT/MGAT family acyltransferase
MRAPPAPGRSIVKRLSGLDAAFLAIETPSAPMHVLGVVVVDPSTAPVPFGPERVRDLFEARLHLVPPLRRRVVETPLGLHAPVWVEDPDFDLHFHLRRAALPAPGGPGELAALVAEIAGRPLDRARPLWEAWVVEGLDRGHVAVVTKLHHALIDGAAGIDVLSALFDLAPDAPLESLGQPAPEWQPERVPGELEMLARAGLALAGRPWQVVRAATNLGRGVARAARAARGHALDLALPLTAPRLSMNRTLTPRRAVAFSSIGLGDVKSVKQALGVTVNDVVLAVMTGALRTYLRQRGELPDRSLVAAIPTNERANGDHEFGNRVSAMFAALPVEVADPVERVAAIRRSTQGAKEVHDIVGGATLEEWAAVASPALFSRGVRVYGRLRVGERVRPIINLVVSNVPGPSFPLYIAGARLVALHPLGPIFDDCGLNATVLSYLDHVDFGFIACRELVPDLDGLAAAVPDALAELAKLAN